MGVGHVACRNMYVSYVCTAHTHVSHSHVVVVAGMILLAPTTPLRFGVYWFMLILVSAQTLAGSGVVEGGVVGPDAGADADAGAGADAGAAGAGAGAGAAAERDSGGGGGTLGDDGGLVVGIGGMLWDVGCGVEGIGASFRSNLQPRLLNHPHPDL
eukprot:1374379-Amorphochlora_amoeboformis.AAC.1